MPSAGGDADTGGGDAGTGSGDSDGGSASSSGGCCAPMGGGEPLGTCLQESLVSSAGGGGGGGGGGLLPQDTCAEGSVCVPQQFIQDPSAGLRECTSESMGEGGCVPECFEMVPAGALPQGDCQNGEACVSCGLLGSATSRAPEHCSSGDAGMGVSDAG